MFHFSKLAIFLGITLGCFQPLGAVLAETITVPEGGYTYTSTDTSNANTYVTSVTGTAPVVTFSNLVNKFNFKGQIQGNLAVNIAMSGNGIEFYTNGSTSNYTGGTIISAGRVFLSTGKELGLGTITMNNGTHMVNCYAGSQPVVDNDIVLSSGTAVIRTGWGSKVNADSTGRPVSITLNGDISGAGGIQFGQEGTPGKVALYGTNTYAGNTTINYDAGGHNYYQYAYFVLGSDSPFGTGTVTASGKFSGAENLTSLFEMDAAASARNVSISALNIDAGRKVSLTKTGTNTANLTVNVLGGTGTVTGTKDVSLTLNPTEADATYNGSFGGEMTLYKTGSRVQYLNNSGTSDFTGDVYLQGGIFACKTGKELGTGTIYMADGTHLLNNGGGSNPVYNNNIVVAEGKTAVIRAGWGAIYNDPTSLTTNGVISGNNIKLNYSNEPTPGRININGANTYSGTTTINFDLRWNEADPLKNNNRYEHAFISLGSALPFGTSQVNVSGTQYNQPAETHSEQFTTVFQVNNTDANLNVGIGKLSVMNNRTLLLTQASTTSGFTANLTVEQILGPGTVSNRLSSRDGSTYGSSLDRLTIARTVPEVTSESNVILDGDFDLYINVPFKIGFYQAFTSTKDVTATYTGDIYLQSGILASPTGKALGSGTIHMSNGTHLVNYYGSTFPVYENDIDVNGTVVIRGGWGAPPNHPQRFMTLNGDIYGTGKVNFGLEGTPAILVLNGNNTYSGGTLINYGIESRNRYPYGYFVLGSDSPFGVGSVQISTPTRLEFNTLTSDKLLSNDVTIDSGKALYLSAVGEKTAYINGTVDVNGSLTLLNPKSATVIKDSSVQLQALSVPDGNISRFSLSSKDGASAGVIDGNLTLEKDAVLTLNGLYNDSADTLPGINGTLNLKGGSVLELDLTNIADINNTLISINDINAEDGSVLKLLTDGKSDVYRLIQFGNGVNMTDLSSLLATVDGGWTFDLTNGTLSATATPEPSAFVLAFLSLTGLFFLSGRRDRFLFSRGAAR